MTFVGKKLLVLAGAAVHVKVVEAAKKLGVYTIVADYLQPEKSPAKRIADEHLECDIFDIDGLTDYCRQHHVDGVIDFCIDPAQRPAQQIAERAGLPTFGTWEQVVALTDKRTFKAKCREAGVDLVPTYTLEDVRSGRAEFPLIVKPVDSRGSRGICRCSSIGEVKTAIEEAQKCSSDGGYIIEKCMTPENSQDLTISYLVKDGEPILVSLGDRHSGRREDNLDRQLVCTIQPSRYVAEYLADGDIKIKRLIKLIGIKNGPVFFQGFFDHGAVRLYDPGLRYPGNEYERILAVATGVDLMTILVKCALGGEIDLCDGRVETCFDLGGKTCLQYMVNARAGKIAAYDGLDEIARHPTVVDVTQKRFVGDEIANTGDIGHRIGEISILCERTVKAMKDSLAYVQSRLSVRDENDSDMLISPFSPSSLDNWYTNYEVHAPR